MERQIKDKIDSCIGKDINSIEIILKFLLDDLSNYVLQSYDSSREVVQYAISRLERIHDMAVPFMMSQVLNYVGLLGPKFEKFKEGDTAYVKADWQETDIKNILQKIRPYIEGNINMAEPDIKMAKSLTQDERHKMASFVIDSIQRFGSSTQWDKDTFENHQLYLWILYSICKLDNQLIPARILKKKV